MQIPPPRAAAYLDWAGRVWFVWVVDPAGPVGWKTSTRPLFTSRSRVLSFYGFLTLQIVRGQVDSSAVCAREREAGESWSKNGDGSAKDSGRSVGKAERAPTSGSKAERIFTPLKGADCRDESRGAYKCQSDRRSEPSGRKCRQICS
jgi:hypothetical protein